MFEKITKTLSGLAFIKYINSLIDYVNTSDIDATRIKGQLDISNIPPAGLDNVIKVDTVTDMLALTVDDVQNGDTVMIIGVIPPVQYQVVDDTKLGTMDAFQEYAAGTATKALADINGNNIHTTYGKLAGNNTWTGNNYWNGSAIFNANLTIRGSATTPGDVSTYLWLGTQPEGSKQTPSIARNKIGDLIMYAADYRPCYLRSGIQTSFASVYNSDGTVEFSSLNNTPWGKYTNANGLELTVNKTPTVNTDVSNKKYVDDSIANGDVNSAKYLNITNFIPSNSDFNDYKTPGEYQVQSNTEANTIANLPTSYNDATPRGGVLSVLIGFNAPRTSLVQIYRTYGSSYVVSRTYQRCFYHENSSWTAWREIACTDEVGLLNQANTYTALNTFRANIAVSNGTTAGSGGSVSFGVSPADEPVQTRISTDNLGGLFYHVSTNQPHVFRIGTNNNVFAIRDDDTKVAFSSNNNLFATVTHDGVAKWLGNANTATKALADINGNNIHTTYGKLAGNNTWTGNNYWNGSAIFNANLTIRGSATTPGDVSTYLWLGTQPEGSKQTPSIARNKIGDLIMYAADYRPCYLRSGIQTSFASVYNSDGTVEFSSLNNTPWGKYTNANGLELTVNKTPTVNTDVSNKKYVDDSIANGDVNSAKYLNITNFIPSNSDFNDYKTPGEYQVQSNTEANTIANLPTSYNDATPRGGVLSVLIGFNAPRTSLVQIYRTYGSSYVVSRTYQRCFYHENSSWTAWREIACTDEVGLLNQANTYTALNTFRANIAVSNGTTAGSGGSVSFGVSPADEPVQTRISTDNLGGLFYHVSTNQPHVFRIGTNNNVFAIRDDDTKVAFSSNNNLFATVTHDGVAKWLGNANTATTATSAKSATKLATARTITANLASSAAGSFDGSADITVGVTGTLPIANGGTGSTTADAARTALGCAPAYIYSTTDLTAGSSALTTGTLYIVYE
ncbi:MAG: pyocin knob domain-containing protein [Terrisporobacter sp.]|uniref:pyocin knob domain-containing protein n=1 Tax=Terrisporobacter sp. TaxID=1965305 RepID=UPI00399A9076